MNPAFFFPSITCQLADNSPDIALALHNTLKAIPLLMDDILAAQADKLFEESLKVATALDPSKVVIIIIDGLDEMDTCLGDMADIFSQVLQNLPPNIKVFISS